MASDLDTDIEHDSDFMKYWQYAHRQTKDAKPFTDEEAIKEIGLPSKVGEFYRGLLCQSVSTRDEGGTIAEFVASTDAFMGYQEYIELHEARASSRSARCWAITAIIASVVLGVISLFSAFWIANRPTHIDDAQIQQITTVIEAADKAEMDRYQRLLLENEIDINALGKAIKAADAKFQHDAASAQMLIDLDTSRQNTKVESAPIQPSPVKVPQP